MTTGQKAPTALGTEKIGKLLMQYAIPAIVAMTASSLYNMVDSIFIGHGVGRMAISGLALTFQCAGVEYHNRFSIYCSYFTVSRSHPLLLRREGGYYRICP